MSPYKAVIFDMGNVLFRWHPKDVSIEALRDILRTDLWLDFERGTMEPDECYRQLGAVLSMEPTEIASLLKQVNLCLTPANEMTTLLRALQSHHADIGLYMMTNIPRLDYDRLRAAHASYIWDAFDAIFASGYAGMRKPDRCFHEYALEAVGALPSEIIFVDDEWENVRAAEEIGMRGVHCRDIGETARLVGKMLCVQEDEE